MTDHDAEFIPCHTFGGGWIVATTEAGQDSLEAFFNDDPAFLMPIDEAGWIVEPQDMEALAEWCRDQSVKVMVDV